MKACAIATGLMIATLLPLWAATVPLPSPAGRTVASRDGHFEFVAPQGWTVRHDDHPETFVTLSKGDDQLALTFFPSSPKKWNLASLMEAQEQGARKAFGNVELAEKRDLGSVKHPSALSVYRLPGGPPDGPAPIVGCVILESGGVGILGIAAHPDSILAAESVIRSVRPVGAKKP